MTYGFLLTRMKSMNPCFGGLLSAPWQRNLLMLLVRGQQALTKESHAFQGRNIHHYPGGRAHVCDAAGTLDQALTDSCSLQPLDCPQSAQIGHINPPDTRPWDGDEHSWLILRNTQAFCTTHAIVPLEAGMAFAAQSTNTTGTDTRHKPSGWHAGHTTMQYKGRPLKPTLGCFFFLAQTKTSWGSLLTSRYSR